MKNIKLIIFSLFLLLSFSINRADASVSLQLSALNISGVTATGTATMPTFSLNINTNDLSDFSSTAVFGINIFDTYNSSNQSFSGNAGSGAITVQTGVLQQTKTIAITQPLTTNSTYFARVFYTSGSNLDFVYSNVVSFKFGDSTSVNNTFAPASAATVPTSANGFNSVIITPNTSGTESGKWWFKQAKDSEAKGPFSGVAECEAERAKGNSYSKQCFQFYYPLAPLPGQADKIDTTTSGDSDCPFGNYLNILIKLFIGICAVLAMIKIVLGGMQYMTSELSSGKEDGKNSITSAVFGLILALGAFAILNTINPELLKVCLNNLPKATVVISPTDTSTGSNQSLCISKTNPPSINNVTGTTLNLNSSITNEYIPARDSLNLPTGIKLLITAQTAVEGFSSTPVPGTKSYKTKNPGNIGNTDNGSTKTFPTLVDGIIAQKNIITNVANNSSVSYKLGSKPTCALGDEKYDGYLYQYLRIYSTGARMNNNYLSNIIGFFAANGKTITPKTTIAQIYALN